MKLNLPKKIILFFSTGVMIAGLVITPILLFKTKDKKVDLKHSTYLTDLAIKYDSENYKGFYKFPDGYVYNIKKNEENDLETFKSINQSKFIDTNLNKKFKNAASANNFKNSLSNYYSKKAATESITENFLIDFYVNKEDPSSTFNHDDIFLNEEKTPNDKLLLEELKKKHINSENELVRKFFLDFFDKYINTPVFKRISAYTEITNRSKEPISHFNLKLISNSQAERENADFSQAIPEVKKILGDTLKIFKKNKDMPMKILSFKVSQNNGKMYYTPSKIDAKKDWDYKIKLKKPLLPGEKVKIKAKYLKQLVNFGGKNVLNIFKKFFKINFLTSNFYNRKSNQVYNDSTFALPKIIVKSKLSKVVNVKFQYPKKYFFSIKTKFLDKKELNELETKQNAFLSFNPLKEISFFSLRKTPLKKGVLNGEEILPIEYDLTSNVEKMFKDNFLFEKTNLVMKELQKKLNINIKEYYKSTFYVTSAQNINGGYFFLGDMALSSKELKTLKNDWLHEFIHAIYGSSGMINSFESTIGVSFFEETITEFLKILYLNKLNKETTETIDKILEFYKRKDRTIYSSAALHINRQINEGLNELFWFENVKPLIDENKKPILSSFDNNPNAKFKSLYKFGPLIHLEFFAIYKDKYLEVIKEISHNKKTTGRNFNVMDFLNSIGKIIGINAQERMKNALLKPIKKFKLNIKVLKEFAKKYSNKN